MDRLSVDKKKKVRWSVVKPEEAIHTI